MSPAVKPEAKSTPGKPQRAQRPPRPRPVSPGRDRPGVTGRRAHGRPPRQPGTSGGHGGLCACTLGTCSRAPGAGTGARRGSCGSAADTAPALPSRQLWPSPHQGSASWNVGPAGQGPASLASAESWEPGAHCEAQRHSGHRFTAGEWASPRGRQGARGDARPRQRRGAYDEGGAEQLKAGCEV